MSNACSPQLESRFPLAALGDILSGAHSKVELSSPKAAAYLSQLTSLPLDIILAEPDNLSSTSSQLTNALRVTNLCTSSYPTFLSLHHTTTGLTSTLSSFSDALDTLLEDIPTLESAAQSFSSEIISIQSCRRRAALVLEHSSKLQDILELSVLADAYLRGAHFQVALDLAAHAARLAARFPHVQAVQDVHAEANAAIWALLGQLLATLRSPGKLPILFRAVSFPQRMRVFLEHELALASGEAEKRGLDAPDAWVRYMKKYIDTWREVYMISSRSTQRYFWNGRSRICPQKTYIRYGRSFRHAPHSYYRVSLMRSVRHCRAYLTRQN